MILKIIHLANKIQKECSEQHKNKKIDFSDYFSLESIKKRLDGYDIFKTPGLQTLADVMIMLCIRPAEIKTLRISNGGVLKGSGVTGYAKNLGQQYISGYLDH